MVESSQQTGSVRAVSYAARMSAQIAVLKAKDKRVIFDPSGFQGGIYTPANMHDVFRQAHTLVEAVLKVEATARNQWGIQETFKSLSFLPCSPTDLTGISGDGSVRFVLGLPEYNSFFFSAPISVNAHELGHYLSFFDRQGVNRHAGSQTGKNLFDQSRDDLQLLRDQGHLDSKYFEPLPYSLLLPLLDGAGPNGSHNLFDCLQELLADKVSVQLGGRAGARKARKPGLSFYRKIDEPWTNVRLFMQAWKAGLPWYTLNRLYKIVRGQKTEWSSVCSTLTLLENLSAFYDGVSLRSQLTTAGS